MLWLLVASKQEGKNPRAAVTEHQGMCLFAVACDAALAENAAWTLVLVASTRRSQQHTTWRRLHPRGTAKCVQAAAAL